MTSDQLDDALIKAADAEQLINDPRVVEAFSAIRKQAFEDITRTRPSQVEEREQLYKLLKAVEMFEAHFQFYIEEGRLARSIVDKYVAEGRAKRRRRTNSP